jgi:hypothetical protein
MNSGDWVADIDRAHDFKSGPNAMAYMNEHELKNVQLYYSFPDAQYNFHLGQH